MFGSKNKENLEKIENLSQELAHKDEVFSQLCKGEANYSANRSEVEDAIDRVESDVNQLGGKLEEAGALLSENEKTISGMNEALTEELERKKQQSEDYKVILGKIEKLSTNSMEAVENNKHFTSSSKMLSDFADSMKKEYMDNIRELKLMQEFSKQMSVLSLNAAIEAGRMGESGGQFVSACESIRSYAANYENSVRTLLDKIEISAKKVGELDEEVHKIVNQLKDNNVAVSKLMKDISEVSKNAKDQQAAFNTAMLDETTEHVKELWDKTGEIGRMEERNRMQLDDIKEEMELVKKDSKEIFSELDAIYQLTK